MTDGAGTTAFVFRADRLCRIFNNYQMMLGSQFHHRIHVGHLTIEMNGDDGTRAAGDLGCNFRAIQVVGRGINIYKNGRSSHPSDSSGRGKKSIGGSNDLIPRPDIFRHQANQQSIAARRDANRVRAGRIFRDGCFAGHNFRSQNKMLRRHHLSDCGFNFFLDGGVLRLKIEQRNLHTSLPP